MLKAALIAITAAATAIAVSVIASDGGHSKVYAADPTPTRASQSSQSSQEASQALRRYTLQLLNILSDERAANKWARYWQAKARCDVPPSRLQDASQAGSNATPFDRSLMALNAALCGGLERRLVVNPGDYPNPHANRTVGLLVNEPNSMGGYTLIAGRFDNYVHLIDHLGRIAHSWRFERWLTHAKLLQNGNLLVELREEDGTWLSEVDMDGNVVWKYTHADGFHHDFLKMPNGNALILSTGSKTREEAIAAGANPAVVPSEGMEYDYLLEVRPTGSEGGDVVWKWAAWDYIAQDFDPTKENYADPSDHPELIDINFLMDAPQIRPGNGKWNWLHTNGIEYNPALDQIILSPRHHSELWIIDHSASVQAAPTRAGGNAGKGGALLYRWGNPRAYGHGTAADQRLFWQHHTQWIAPGLPGAGNILVFNNGQDGGKGIRLGYSSIEEIVPPIDGYGYRREPQSAYPPSEPVWTYTAETPSDFYSTIMGCVQRLPNGNTLICESTSGTLFQVTPDGKTVWKYVYPLDDNTPLKQGEQPSIIPERTEDALKRNAVYRAYWYAPDYPGLQKYDLTPGDTIEIYE